MDFYSQFRKKNNETTLAPENNVFIQGKYCTVQSIKWDKHAESICKNLNDESIWAYIPLPENTYDYPHTPQDLIKYFSRFPMFQFYMIKIKGQDECVGMFSLMQIIIPQQQVQLGFVMYSKRIQRTRITTQAFYLIASYAIEKLNFNRFYWKCHALNVTSKNAATRFGYQLEGTKRHQRVQSGCYRDTTYYSILKPQWLELKNEFQRWLNQNNFDQKGNELSKLKCKQIRELMIQKQKSKQC